METLAVAHVADHNFLKIRKERRGSSMLLTTMVGRLLEDIADETPISTEADESPYAYA